jgi:hypothetical protein
MKKATNAKTYLPMHFWVKGMINVNDIKIRMVSQLEAGIGNWQKYTTMLKTSLLFGIISILGSDYVSGPKEIKVLRIQSHCVVLGGSLDFSV